MRDEIELLDVLTSSLESVTIHQLGLGGTYEWSVVAHGPTDRTGEVRTDGITVRLHGDDERFTLHVSSFGATRADALAAAVDLWERRDALLAATVPDGADK